MSNDADGITAGIDARLGAGTHGYRRRKLRAARRGSAWFLLSAIDEIARDVARDELRRFVPVRGRRESE